MTEKQPCDYCKKLVNVHQLRPHYQKLACAKCANNDVRIKIENFDRKEYNLQLRKHYGLK